MKTDEIVNYIENADSFSISDSFDIASTVSILLRQSDHDTDARKIIIFILDNWHKIPKETVEIWVDLIESAGFYPYLEKLKNETRHFRFDNLAGEIRKEYHFSENLGGKYFHEEQKKSERIVGWRKKSYCKCPYKFWKKSFN